MGRELRRVPPDWEHPRDERGGYIPLHDRSYSEAVADYEYGERLWVQGRHPSQVEWPAQTEGRPYQEWVGDPPLPEFYRVESWTEADASCWVVYENITEGTPLSPKLASLEEARGWLLSNGYSEAETAELIQRGYVPTARAYAPGSDGGGEHGLL